MNGIQTRAAEAAVTLRSNKTSLFFLSCSLTLLALFSWIIVALERVNVEIKRTRCRIWGSRKNMVSGVERSTHVWLTCFLWLHLVVQTFQRNFLFEPQDGVILRNLGGETVQERQVMTCCFMSLSSKDLREANYSHWKNLHFCFCIIYHQASTKESAV